MGRYISLAFTKKYLVDEIIIKLTIDEIDYTTYYGRLNYITFEFERVEIIKEENEGFIYVYTKGEKYRLIIIDYEDIEYINIDTF